MGNTALCSACPFSEFWDNSIPIFRNGKVEGKVKSKPIDYYVPPGAQVLIVTEGPSPDDLLANKPLVDGSGSTSKEEFKKHGIDPEQFAHATACRCWVDKKKVSNEHTRAALKCCKPALEELILELKPKLIITYGNNAMVQVLKQSGITGKRGQMMYSKDFHCLVLPTFSPAYCHMDAKHFAFWRPDIAQAVRVIRNDFQEPRVSNNGDYIDVESIDFLLKKENFTVGLDTETQGTDWMDPDSVVVSYSVTDEVGKGYNIWLLMEVPEGQHDFTIKWPRKSGRGKAPTDVFVKRMPGYERKVGELRALLSRKDIKKIMANGNFDLHRFEQLGIPLREINGYVMDIQLAMHSFDPDNFKRASLRDIQTALMPGRFDHKTEFKKTTDKGDMLLGTIENPQAHTVYAGADADSTLGCGLILKDRMLNTPSKKNVARYYSLLAHPVTTTVLYEIEKNGVLFDSSRVSEVKLRIRDELTRLETEFGKCIPPAIRRQHEKAGIRLTRGDFLRDLFYTKAGFGLKPLEFTASKLSSLEKKVLDRVREPLDANHPAFEAISLYMEWRPLQTLYSTYLTQFEKAVRPDGRLHTQVSKTGTATGRTSTKNPGLQNIPKRNYEIMQIIRSLLVAPYGKVLVAIDYSQNELRWIAQKSGEPEFIRTYREGGDIHMRTAMGLLGITDPSQVEPQALKIARQNSKPINFGVSYGMSAKGLQIYARDNYGVKMSLEEAETYRNEFFKTYAGLLPWHAQEIAFAQKNGFCMTPFGGIRLTPNIKSRDSGKRSEDERKAINTPIQAAGSDTTLFAALEARRRGIIDDDRVKLILFVHDELVFEVDEDHVHTFLPRIVDCMENLNPAFKRDFGFEMVVPLKVDPQIGRSLSQMKDYEFLKAA